MQRSKNQAIGQKQRYCDSVLDIKETEFKSFQKVKIFSFQDELTEMLSLEH